MPDLNTSLHTDMLKGHHKGHHNVRLTRRISRVLRRKNRSLYGLQWGDPESVPGLRNIRDHWVAPYVSSDQTAVEIGPGGGRWTRYLLGFQRLYVVDFYDELLAELRKNFNEPNMVFVKNAGADLPGIPQSSVDYVFTMDASFTWTSTSSKHIWPTSRRS